MSCFRVLLCIIFPPLAVIDKGCGSIAIVTILTLCGWIPGVIGALVILNNNSSEKNN
ncbi:MAG: YqaE/Pmp3 family membrane protein [Bacteroidaceae bacterium]|nr:YqaE/Pmp3 family membrane protein [Bacteroidaceae bacterium]MBQ6938827.1 YqaE/Pmp3 family membrane protein [Muribaculaceae bacterium]